MSQTTSLRKPGILVFACGIAFSALVLQGVNWINDHGENIMGWYANGIIPAGALIVGVASGLGYALASRYFNVKLSKAFIWGMVVTGLLDYVAAQYVTYSNLLAKYHASESRYSFGQYLKDICEHMTFKSSSSRAAGSPLGVMGYVYKFLELAGFTIGYVVPSIMLFAAPYCRRCQAYLKKHQTTFLNSPVRTADVKKMKKPQRLEALQNTMKDIGARAQQVINSVQSAPFSETQATLAACDKVGDKKSAAVVHFNLKKCPNCDSHHLSVMLANMTVDKKVANRSLATLNKVSQPAAI